jgi:hypothetical protein
MSQKTNKPRKYRGNANKNASKIAAHKGTVLVCFYGLIPGAHGDSPSVSLVPGETAGAVPMFAFTPHSPFG